MTEDQALPNGPDLATGVPLTDLASGKLAGHVGEEEVVLVRSGRDVCAIAAHCSHYHGPLVEGLVEGGLIRCPWHHAAFDLQTGEAVRAPALSALACWRVEQRNDRVFVRERLEALRPRVTLPADTPGRIVIVGGGAAGFAAAEMLRRVGFLGSIVLVSSDPEGPVDRPNLSKDYLAGAAPEDWVPLRPPSFYVETGIELHLHSEVTDIDTNARVLSAGGRKLAYDRLLLATGAEPVRLTIPGAELPHIHTLRSITDCRSITAAAKSARRALVVGASFIGLEAAAALRAREIEVHVVAPDKRPMERILGSEMGDFIRALHEEHGVIFHLENTVTRFDGLRAVLGGGDTIDAELVVVGIGVRPRLQLPERAGLALDRGVLVNEFLETSVSGIYAAGDIARWPDPRSGQKIRVEHWVVAERQGQTAALNMLGLHKRFDAVPFFWSQHYDVPINYVGHAERWDEIAVDGSVAAKDCLVSYKREGRVLACASIYRDLASLEVEAGMERA
jgi:NADPH-dependent 2,4-dienoyl-CoA reductase/sulfur reductase-like enzyme/nitrite reductase/ring-hydroxylating ferredoxin subunit